MDTAFQITIYGMHGSSEGSHLSISFFNPSVSYSYVSVIMRFFLLKVFLVEEGDLGCACRDRATKNGAASFQSLLHIATR